MHAAGERVGWQAEQPRDALTASAQLRRAGRLQRRDFRSKAVPEKLLRPHGCSQTQTGFPNSSQMSASMSVSAAVFARDPAGAGTPRPSQAPRRRRHSSSRAARPHLTTRPTLRCCPRPLRRMGRWCECRGLLCRSWGVAV